MKYKVMIVEDQTMPRELFELRVQSSEHFEVALSIDNAALADVFCLRSPSTTPHWRTCIACVCR